MALNDVEKKAAEFRQRHGISDAGSKTQSDHPYVEVARMLNESARLLADDKNEAFSQLDKGKFADIFTDETKTFALGYYYACHPLDDIEKDLLEMGITTHEKQTKTIQKDGSEIELTEDVEVPIRFEVTPLKGFIEEWLRKRHAVNRLRVDEFIKLVNGQGIKEMLTRPQQTPQEPMQRGRIV